MNQFWKRKRLQTEQTLAYSRATADYALPVDPLELTLVITMASQVYQKLAGSPCEAIYNQILIELRDLYSEEQQEVYVSICWRLFALYQLIQSGELAEWVNPDVLHTQIPLPRMIVFVASVLPLYDKTGFNPLLFIQTVETCQEFGHR